MAPFRKKPDFKRDRRDRPAARAQAANVRPNADTAILYGWHTVEAALANPNRRIRALYATENAAKRLTADGIALKVTPQIVRPDEIARRLGPDAVHNGLLAEADPLEAPDISELADDGIVLVLDQITDPHNVGAIMRSAAAFGVKALVTTARHSPEATGVLAKSASGALDHVPMVTVPNLARGTRCPARARLPGWSVSTARVTPILRPRRCMRRSLLCSAPRARACGN